MLGATGAGDASISSAGSTYGPDPVGSSSSSASRPPPLMIRRFWGDAGAVPGGGGGGGAVATSHGRDAGAGAGGADASVAAVSTMPPIPVRSSLYIDQKFRKLNERPRLEQVACRQQKAAITSNFASSGPSPRTRDVGSMAFSAIATRAPPAIQVLLRNCYTTVFLLRRFSTHSYTVAPAPMIQPRIHSRMKAFAESQPIAVDASPSFRVVAGDELRPLLAPHGTISVGFCTR